MKDKSHLTAISRKTLPRPTRWLLNQGRVIVHPGVKVLDYGCGRCYKINPKEWDNYDPNFFQRAGGYKKNSYNLIICNYVLCVLPPEERLPVLKDIKALLAPYGVAYVTVRNDKPKQGWGVSSKGTYQGRIRKMPLPELYKNANFRIYLLTKDTELA